MYVDLVKLVMCYLSYHEYIAMNKKTNKLIQYESKLMEP